MASEKKQRIPVPASWSAVDTARRIWLAGLGAFTKAEEEGGRFFEALVKEGEAIEARGRKSAEVTVSSMKDYASKSWENLEGVFEERVSGVLTRLGVPTRDDILTLSKQVAALDKNIKALTKSNGKGGATHRRSAAARG